MAPHDLECPTMEHSDLTREDTRLSVLSWSSSVSVSWKMFCGVEGGEVDCSNCAMSGTVDGPEEGILSEQLPEFEETWTSDSRMEV